MTNLVEAPAEWVAGIYQLETNDPVMGGADGIDNLQAKQLAKRTAYLKAQVEAAQGGLTAHEAAADPHPVYLTSAEGDAKVAAAVAALVAASPATLDTLSELAAALGNDANFAATLTDLLALKAPLNSPALTGTPTAPTAGQFDATEKVATMAAVQRALGNFQGQIIIAAATNIVAADAGKYIHLGGAGYNATLPNLNTVGDGAAFLFESSGGQVNIVRNGADTIFCGASAGITSLSISAGDTLWIAKITVGGTARWQVVGGSVALKYSQAVFGASLAANGYQLLPSGLIIQWGTTAVITAGVKLSVTYPLAWPNGCYSLTAFPVNPGVTATHFVESNNIGASFDIIVNTGTVQAFWMAIGH